MNRKIVGALLLSASAIVLATPALAQQAAATATPGPAKPDPVAIDQIVVTGALRSALLQQVPMAVTAVGAVEFQKSGFKEVRELELLTPGVQIARQGSNAIFIRGSGTASQNAGTEQSVGMVIDGVLMSFVDDIGGDISDLDHIEIYRGPQGTQFAKNASAGVVSVTTKKPVIGQWGGNSRLTYGEHNDTNATTTVNVPIAGNIAGRLTGSFQHRDGVFDNLSIGKKQGAREQFGLRGKVLWKPREGASVIWSADVRRERISPNFPQAFRTCGPGSTATYNTVYGTAANPRLLPPCVGVLAVGVVPSLTNSTSGEADPAFRKTTAGGTSLEIRYPVGQHELVSLSAYRFMSRKIFGPNGSGVYNNQYNNQSYNAFQWSQEFRLVSPAEKRVTYVVGAFLYERVSHIKQLPYGKGYGLVNNSPAAVAYGVDKAFISSNGGKFYADTTNKSIAAFTDGALHVTPQFQINAGIRVTRDRVSANGYTVAVPGIFQQPGTVFKATDADSVSKTGVTARLGPQYFVTPDFQIYATYAHGYKGPLVDTAVQDFGIVKPETVNAYEAGIKSAWFDRRLTLNLAVFDQKFKDYQVATLNTTIVPNAFQLGNAGGQLSRGVELEGVARPMAGLGLQFGLAYLDAKYTDFITSCYTTPLNIATSTQEFKQPQITDPSGKGGCYTGTSGTATVRYTNAAGFPLINASKWTYRLGLTYNKELADGGAVDFTANYIYRSKWYSTAPDPNLYNKGYGVAGFNIGYTPRNGAWRAGAFVRNAFNQFFTAAVQANTSDGGIGGTTNVLNIEAVRTFGVSFDLNF